MNKVWLITGAGSGIGAGTAKAALAAGDQVVATGRNLEKLQAALGAETDRLAFIALDVSDEAQAQAGVDVAVARFGRIDVVVNNAGYSLLGNFEELTSAEFERQFATNFWGVVFLTRAVLPVMRRQRSGHIINISSVAGVVGLKHCTAYGATKFAVEGFSLALATEIEQFGIWLTVVEPGFFRTGLLDSQNITYASPTVADYASEGPAEQMWSPYHGTQPGDPARLGEALVVISAMDDPPKLFVAGSDALAAVVPAIEERLRETLGNERLSRSTDGAFPSGAPQA